MTEALIDYGLLFSLTIFKQFLNAFPISLNISEKLLLGNDFLDIRGSRKYSFGTIGIITFSSPAQTNIVTETRVNMQQLARAAMVQLLADRLKGYVSSLNDSFTFSLNFLASTSSK